MLSFQRSFLAVIRAGFLVTIFAPDDPPCGSPGAFALFDACHEAIVVRTGGQARNQWLYFRLIPDL
ncbi:hypothetical protein D3250_03745 [Nesterenkonia natronophila]|uniref:Uncharacterized protein n=1 Tax=Nesterenkonia natronophila TaxID=2174932 RepID=A0A3A4FKK0_9MICC|nr:hypothetical protein D3250_03745 [Nesterenkonia natronophila]